MDMAAWLRGLGLERYEAAFRDHEINWAVGREGWGPSPRPSGGS
jgi:SAM domain (Sterile alpha motif)